MRQASCKADADKGGVWEHRRECTKPACPVRLRPVNELTELQLGWVAGLLEGEGCFYTAMKRYGDRVYRATRIVCGSTDRDVLERLVLFCGGKVTGPALNGWKPFYSWNLHGLKAASLARAVRPHMCSRRQEKIDELLSNFASTKRQRSKS